MLESKNKIDGKEIEITLVEKYGGRRDVNKSFENKKEIDPALALSLKH